MNIMKVRVAVITLVVVLVLSYFLSQLYFRQNLGDNRELTAKGSQSQAGVTKEYLPNSAIAEAIAKAKTSVKESSYREEAQKLFGLYIFSYEINEYLVIRERLFKNSRLASAIKAAGRELSTVVLSREFGVGSGWVDINVNAPDEEIISFLSENVLVAKTKKENFERLKKEASQYGLTMFFPSEGELYKQIKSRLATNRNLVRALQTAVGAGLTVYPGRIFYTGKNYVEINVDATDEEIITFLLGK